MVFPQSTANSSSYREDLDRYKQGGSQPLHPPSFYAVDDDQIDMFGHDIYLNRVSPETRVNHTEYRPETQPLPKLLGDASSILPKPLENLYSSTIRFAPGEGATQPFDYKTLLQIRVPIKEEEMRRLKEDLGHYQSVAILLENGRVVTFDVEILEVLEELSEVLRLSGIYKGIIEEMEGGNPTDGRFESLRSESVKQVMKMWWIDTLGLAGLVLSNGFCGVAALRLLDSKTTKIELVVFRDLVEILQYSLEKPNPFAAMTLGTGGDSEVGRLLSFYGFNLHVESLCETLSLETSLLVVFKEKDILRGIVANFELGTITIFDPQPSSTWSSATCKGLLSLLDEFRYRSKSDRIREPLFWQEITGYIAPLTSGSDGGIELLDALLVRFANFPRRVRSKKNLKYQTLLLAAGTSLDVIRDLSQ